MAEVKLREARKADVEAIVVLVERLKRLNEEFDPLFRVRGDARERTRRYLESGVERPDRFILVAEDSGRVIGMLKAEIRERIFYDPASEGAIIEFYLMPENRHGGLGRKMIEEATKRLRERGVQLITAEFPSMNKISASFYERLGYRAILSIYGKAL